jgi:hypothetical protein
MVSWLRGGRSTVFDGDPHGRRRRRGELTRSALMAGGSTSNPVLVITIIWLDQKVGREQDGLKG